MEMWLFETTNLLIEKSECNISIHLESLPCPPDKYKPNIYSHFGPVLDSASPSGKNLSIKLLSLFRPDANENKTMSGDVVGCKKLK